MLDPRMPCTILIVEDERVLREELRFQLAQHGFVVEAFASAEEFDQRLPWVARKIAVLDIGLEGEDGLSMCRRLAVAPAGEGAFHGQFFPAHPVCPCIGLRIYVACQNWLSSGFLVCRHPPRDRNVASNCKQLTACASAN